MAIEKGYLTLRGRGYRKERKGSPLANIYRQYCDAQGMPCVNVLLAGTDTVVLVELSTTRAWVLGDDGVILEPAVLQRVRDEVVGGCDSASQVAWLGAKEVAEVVPWTVLAPPEVVENNTGEGVDEDIIEHYFRAPVWQMPPVAMGASIGDRALAKRLASSLASVRYL
jgi:hypothetical protein